MQQWKRYMKKFTEVTVVIVLSCLVGLGCAEDLDEAGGENQSEQNDGEIDGDDQRVTHDEQEQWTTTTVDASDEDREVLLNLDDGREVASESRDSEDWHLAFQRFSIEVNGGVSGPGSVTALIDDESDFEDLEQAPDGRYGSDQEGEVDDRGQDDGLVF